MQSRALSSRVIDPAKQNIILTVGEELLLSIKSSSHKVDERQPVASGPSLFAGAFSKAMSVFAIPMLIDWGFATPRPCEDSSAQSVTKAKQYSPGPHSFELLPSHGLEHVSEASSKVLPQ